MKKLLVVSLALMLLFSFALAKNDVRAKPRIPVMEVPGTYSVPSAQRMEYCELSHYNTASGWFQNAGWFWHNEVVKNFFDPAMCPSFLPPDPYPFSIDSVWIPIYFPNGMPEGTYTFAVDIECADLTNPNCPYPGPIVCYHPFEVSYNGIGNYLFQNPIPINCCMDQPFFLSLHFLTSPEPDYFPGLVYDTCAIGNCIQYYNYPTEWSEWHSTYLYQGYHLGNWVKVLYGDANEPCVPEVCPGGPSGCIHVDPGDSCASPILLSGLTWTGSFDLCDYCNDYDLSPCTGWASNAADMVFKAHFTDDDNNLYVSVTPSGSWDIALAIISDCGDFSAASCLAGEDDMGAGLPESATLTGLAAGDYFIIVSGYQTACGPFDIVVSSNHQLPVELVSFAGVAGNREAKLTWTTASETNNDHFYVIRCTDNRNFIRVSGNIAGTNSATGGTYSYLDRNLVNNTTYFYKLVDVDINGMENVNSLVVNVMPTLNGSITPDAYALYQNYPNPFNPTTTISYDIREAGHVTLTVFDVLGREIAKVVDGYQEAASYSVDFNAATLSSGIYFYQLKVNDFSDLKKMVILK
jgi:hypothetical protein